MFREQDETGNTLAETAGQTTLALVPSCGGTELAAGLSQAELAERVHYSKGYLSKIKMDILSIGKSSAEVWLVSMTADGAGWAMPMNCRDALVAGVSSYARDLQARLPALLRVPIR